MQSTVFHAFVIKIVCITRGKVGALQNTMSLFSYVIFTKESRNDAKNVLALHNRILGA